METIHKHLFDKYAREVRNQGLTDIQQNHQLVTLYNRYNVWFCCRVSNISTNHIAYDIEYLEKKEAFKFEQGSIYFDHHQLDNLLDLNRSDVIKVVCSGSHLLSWEKIQPFDSYEYKEPTKPISKERSIAIETMDVIYFWRLWFYGIAIVASVGGIAYANEPAQSFLAVILMMLAGVVIYAGGAIVLVGFVILTIWSLFVWLQRMSSRKEN